MSFIPFPSIQNVTSKKLMCAAKYVYSGNVPDVLNFSGTVKLDGTHADLVQYANDHTKFVVQSRNQILDMEHDQFGVGCFFYKRQDIVLQLFDNIRKQFNDACHNSTIRVAGEFCGRGLQNSAVCKLDPMFVFFGIQIDDVWVDMTKMTTGHCAPHIYNIYEQLPFYKVEIDMSNMQDGIDKMLNLTKDVDLQCPFANSLGVQGFGQGIFWTCEEKQGNTNMWFKTTVESHCVPIKYKPIDQDYTQIFDCMTNERMMQAILFMQHMPYKPTISMSNIHTFYKYVVDDLIREETFQGIKERTVRKVANKIACGWYKSYINIMRLV